MVCTRIRPFASDLASDNTQRLTGLINEVYDAESSMRKRKGTRTNPAAIKRLLRAQALILAGIDGVLVGSVNINRMGKGVGEFGMLADERKHRGQGIGAALVNHLRALLHAYLTDPNEEYPVKAAARRALAAVGNHTGLPALLAPDG